MYRKTLKGYVIPIFVLKNINSNSNRQELEKLLVAVGRNVIAKIEIEAKVPEFLKAEFMKELVQENNRLAAELAVNADKSLQMGADIYSVVEKAEIEMKKSAKRFSGIISKYDEEFRAYLFLQELERLGYESYLYISEISDRTCVSCFSHHSQVYSVEELGMQHIIPPIHTNCRCALIAMDRAAESCYNLNKPAFLEELELLELLELEENKELASGGIFLLNPDFQSMGISLTKMMIPEYPAIKDINGNDKTHWYDALRNWAGDFKNDAKAALDAIISTSSQRGQNIFRDVPSFFDWLTLGNVSGIFGSNVSRTEEMLQNPNAETISDWLLSGGVTTLSNSLNPDEPLSFEHWMNSLGLAITVYSGYKLANGAKGTARVQPNNTVDSVVGDVVDQGPNSTKLISNRLKYMGRTPGKASRTGRSVIERMTSEGKIKIINGEKQFQASNGSWYPLREADMAHKIDCVSWWNETGRQYGAKSPEVRKFMLDANNYYLEHYRINRSQGASLRQTYLPPLE